MVFQPSQDPPLLLAPNRGESRLQAIGGEGVAQSVALVAIFRTLNIATATGGRTTKGSEAVEVEG